MKKAGIITGILFLVLVLVMLIFIVVAAWTGKGKIQSFYDETGKKLEGSIAEKTFIDVNGRKNGLIIRGKSKENPVLLFISGGPGVPQYWMNETISNQIENDFTVCWWDYRGEGMSYDSKIPSEEITVEQLADDAVVVAQYLEERFGKEKIYLMAHSGGTPLGFYLAQEKPDSFYCYFAMGQSIKEGNRKYEDGYYFMKQIFEETNNKKALTYLNRLVEIENGQFTIRKPETLGMDWEKALLMTGCGTTREMRSDALGIFFPQMLSACYTLPEKINFWRGKAFISHTPYDDYEVSVKPEKPAQIPVYFLSGYYDYTTPVSLVSEFYNNLEAPDKELYIFKDSAHSPLWEENKKALEIMKKCCQKKQQDSEQK